MNTEKSTDELIAESVTAETANKPIMPETNCGIATWFVVFGIIIITSAFFLFLFLMFEQFLLALSCLFGGLFSGLFCFGFAKIVNAAHKYLQK